MLLMRISLAYHRFCHTAGTNDFQQEILGCYSSQKLLLGGIMNTLVASESP